MFSKTAEYALRATIYIAQQSSASKKPGIDEIARAIDSPRSFTAKILQQLTRENAVITSVRGPNGGFYLSEKAKQLPAIKILEAIGEEHVLQKCILGLKNCSDENPCPMHHEYRHIKAKLIELFSSKTIAELADDPNTRLRLLISPYN